MWWAPRVGMNLGRPGGEKQPGGARGPVSSEQEAAGRFEQGREVAHPRVSLPRPGMSERERQVMKKLKEVVDKQRDEIRAKDRELGLKNEDVEAVSDEPRPPSRPAASTWEVPRLPGSRSVGSEGRGPCPRLGGPSLRQRPWGALSRVATGTAEGPWHRTPRRDLSPSTPSGGPEAPSALALGLRLPPGPLQAPMRTGRPGPGRSRNPRGESA